MKIAIVGATGFVGSQLVKEALLRNHTVTAIARNPGKLDIEHPNLIKAAVDVYDKDKLVKILKGQDVVLNAYSPGVGHEDLYALSMKGTAIIQQAVKEAGVKRFLVAGGAGSLEIAPGLQLVDSPDFPAAWKPTALAARDNLNELKKEKELDWTYLSPAIEMHHGTAGVRVGKYRTGKDQPVFDEKGVSRISVEDIAVALLDELENNKFVKQRFTVAY
jgi:uncharacterized protein